MAERAAAAAMRIRLVNQLDAEVGVVHRLHMLHRRSGPAADKREFVLGVHCQRKVGPTAVVLATATAAAAVAAIIQPIDIDHDEIGLLAAADFAHGVADGVEQ